VSICRWKKPPLQERHGLSPGLVSRFGVKSKGIIVVEVLRRIGESVPRVFELQERCCVTVVLKSGSDDKQCICILILRTEYRLLQMMNYYKDSFEASTHTH